MNAQPVGLNLVHGLKTVLLIYEECWLKSNAAIHTSDFHLLWLETLFMKGSLSSWAGAF
jgi:hypothetical protein